MSVEEYRKHGAPGLAQRIPAGTTAALLAEIAQLGYAVLTPIFQSNCDRLLHQLPLTLNLFVRAMFLIR